MEAIRKLVIQVLETPEYHDRSEAYASQSKDGGCAPFFLVAVGLFFAALATGIVGSFL